jgi:hypothetical protein
VLVAGLTSFAGCLGTGVLVLRLIGVHWPAPFLQTAAVLLGLHLQSLAVQALAMAQAATPPALIGVLIAMVALGACGLAMLWRSRQSRARPAIPSIALALLVAVAAIGLAASVVPSTKIDEVYYVSLFAGRLLADHGLVAYRQPVEATVLLQMTYAAGAAPLHALGFPDAFNVVSWALGLSLVWFGWRLLREQGTTVQIPYVIVAAVAVGAYPLVFLVTVGSHALGDLALAATVVGLACTAQLIAASGPVPYAALMSLLSWSAASAKLSLVPVSGVCLLMAAVPAWRAAAGHRPLLVLALGWAWLAFGAPIAAWDWLHTGSPFGPVLADLLGSTFFSPGAFAEYAARTRDNDWKFDGSFLLDNGAARAGLVWLAVVGFFLSSGWSGSFRWMAAGLLLGQAILLVALLPAHVRFLGGLPAGLAICCALRPPGWMEGRRSVGTAVALLLVVPWLAGQLFYGAQFVPRALGLEDGTVFLRRHIALFDDFQRLDSLLPRDAVLLAPGMRAASAYAPRPILFDPADLPGDRPAYLLDVAGSDPPDGIVVGPEVYANPAARLSIGRRWWVPASEGDLRVYSVRRGTSLR